MHEPTIEKLHALRLGEMANALTAQLQQPEIDAMPFDERLALLVDIQHSAMLTAALRQRLTRAGMRQSACMENLDLRTPRGLDRSTIQGLAGGLSVTLNSAPGHALNRQANTLQTGTLSRSKAAADHAMIRRPFRRHLGTHRRLVSADGVILR